MQWVDALIKPYPGYRAGRGSPTGKGVPGMLFKKSLLIAAAIACCCHAMTPQQSFGQAYGVELQASMLPASGGMGGTGIARPQDLQTTLALNPATLSQFKGTQFSFSGGWVEPTLNLETTTPLAGGTIEPFKAKSQRPGSIVGNIGVTQDFTALGIPATVGLGLLTASGLGSNYNQVIASNGTAAEMQVLQTAIGAGVELTDRLSLGFQGTVGSASMDGIFAGISSSTPAYNLRAALGLTYELREATTIGGYWHTKQQFNFDNFVRLGGQGQPFQDFKVSLPNKYGLGIADTSLLDGKLLVAVDFMYFRWSDTDFFGAMWEDQFAVQSGLQYTTDRGAKLRAGYVYADNASRDIVAPSFGPITPQAGVDYVQALFPNINQHRISGGIGLTDILPGVDLDLFAGGMFRASQTFGTSTGSVESYWVGFGSTWRFGRGGCKQDSAPVHW
ncbi:Outer membrane protein transport protein (OMPP1/FadL/TodX) [Allorhodopirellula heiligendammensis]|uniref:Outer membrane protein transport protein (OMPP1/FadL/TodX) n=2 Tax=Allorhodopirellula heiligendammensis TaxID=2714739 RepID=A0A5C6C379_9BACT|nr:Outer membrane protein transport protein (OMPP1/FadL/TodX) [Allorhodopirellula heiligendammensis]